MRASWRRYESRVRVADQWQRKMENIEKRERKEKRLIRHSSKIKMVIFAVFSLFLLFGSLTETAAGQGCSCSASGDVALVSKYLWRGQRLTNDWSLQPSLTFGAGGFSVNTWATMDLTGVNPGDALPILPGDGLKGKFSEVDYTFSYSQAFEGVGLDYGIIFYTFPERSASLASTAEIYAGATLDSAPLSPSFTLYLDVDETRAQGGTTGLYFNIAGGHAFDFNHDVFTALDLSGSISIVNSGFTEFHYRESSGGFHDINITATLPISLGDHLSAAVFISYSSLLGENIRAAQFQDPREMVRPTGASYADTVWGGLSLSLSF